MPFGVKPICTSCKITSSTLWRKGSNGNVYCNSCGIKQLNGTLKENIADNSPNVQAKNGNQSHSSSQGGHSGPVLRKSTRIKPTKKSTQAANKPISTKGKGRRVIFKKNPPLKAPSSVATVVTGESVFHDNQYFQVGDIVSLVDHEGGVYYAQLRGFLSDQYNEKSAVITWLLPTTHSPADKFDPNTYILGPEEDLPRRMEFMEFVCHAPSDYFRARNAPYKTFDPDPDLCCIWTSIGPRIQTTPTIDQIFGVGGHGDQDVAGAGMTGDGDLNSISPSTAASAKDRKKHLVKLDIEELLTPS